MFPRLLQIGNYSIPTYGAMMAAGIAVGTVVVRGLSKRYGVAPDKALNLATLVVVVAILGAKVPLFADDWSYYSQHLEQVFSRNTFQAGGVFYGGLLAALVAATLYMRHNSMSVPKVADVFAPAIAIGHALGRLGCFAAGCCYGKPTIVPWGMEFTSPLAKEYSGTPLGVHLHPTQLYESLGEFGNFFFLVWILRHKKFDGQVISSYLFLYGLERFFIEFLRGDPGRGSMFGGFVSAAQLISILLLLGTALFVVGRVPTSSKRSTLGNSTSDVTLVSS